MTDASFRDRTLVIEARIREIERAGIGATGADRQALLRSLRSLKAAQTRRLDAKWLAEHPGQEQALRELRRRRHNAQRRQQRDKRRGLRDA